MLPTAFVQNSDSAEPLYRQLGAHIAALIRNGAFAGTGQLPSVRDLAKQASVSRNTAAAAYGLLRAQGYIISKNRSSFRIAVPGSFIFPQPEKAPFVYPAAQEDLPPAITDLSNGTKAGIAEVYGAAAAAVRLLYRKAVLPPDTDMYLSTGDPSGNPPLRETLARYLSEKRGVICSADQILIGSGTEHVLQIAVRILQARTGRDSLYAVEDPGCITIRKIIGDSLLPAESEFANIRNTRTTGIPLDKNGISVEKLNESGADIVCVTPAHQFPAGSTMTLDRKTELLHWAYKTPNRYIIEDSYDSDFYYAANQPPALQGIDSQGRVLYFGTFSQIMTPSVQAAYLILPPQLVHLFRRQFAYYSCTVPSTEQHVITAFLQEGYAERILAQMRKFNKVRRDFCIRQFTQKIPGIRITGSETGTFFLAEFDSVPDGQRFIQLLRLQGVAVQTAVLMPESAALIVKYPFLTETDCVFAADTIAKVYFETLGTIPLEE